MNVEEFKLEDIKVLRGKRAPVDCEKCDCYRWPGIHKDGQPVWVCSNCYTVTLRIVRRKLHLVKGEVDEKSKPMNNVEEVIEKLKVEIKRVKKEQSRNTAYCNWNKNELERRVSARLVGRLNGLRFALGLLQGKKGASR